MKKRDLQECFEKMQPSEALIAQTLEKVEKTKNTSHRTWNMPIRQLAAVAGVFLLVLGVWAVGRQAVKSPIGESPVSLEVPEKPDFPNEPDVSTLQTAGLEPEEDLMVQEMLNRAKTQYDYFVLLKVTVTAVEKSTQPEDGAAESSVITMASPQVLDVRGKNNLFFFHKNDQIQGKIQWKSDTQQGEITDSVGSSALVLLIPEEHGGELPWTIADCQLVTAE